MGKVLVVNPNSSAVVTQGIVSALAPLGDCFEVTDLPDSPATIASDEDVARAGLGFLELARRCEDVAVFVTACFSDPGLELVRAAVTQPVIGVQEAGILTALARADRFGIIALSPKSIPRHLRKMRMMGVEGRLAAELALDGVSAAASGTDPLVYEQVRRLAVQLGDMGAGAIVLGCAGMAPIRARLEAETGLAVIDPIVAAGAMALGIVKG